MFEPICLEFFLLSLRDALNQLNFFFLSIMIKKKPKTLLWVFHNMNAKNGLSQKQENARNCFSNTHVLH